MDNRRQQSQNLSRTYTLAGEAVGDKIWSEADETLKPGAILDDKFEIIAELGRGGMGVVYRVKHRYLDKEMALKTFHSEAIDQDAALRFEREARSIARLQHQNIVQIFDFGSWGKHGTPYYAMELLQGESLAERLDRTGPLPVYQSIEIFIDVARALDYAANLGIIHRDIKPANIFLAKDKGEQFTVKIVDFGIAKLIGTASPENKQLTSTGLIFGSPLYMAPEQALGSKVTAQSDIYSCGCALYETVTGYAPFRGANAMLTMQMHITTPAPDLPQQITTSAEGKRLNTVLSNMLAKDQSERYQSGSELAGALMQIQPAQTLALATNGQVKRPTSNNSTSEPPSQSSGPTLSTKRLILTLAIVALTGLALSLSFIPKSTPDNSHHSEFIGPIPDSMRRINNNNNNNNNKLLEPANNKYYSTINADGSRTFRFPEKISLGRLESPQSFWPGKDAQGVVEVPPHLMLCLKSSHNVLASPELLDLFRPDDLTRIELGSVVSDFNSATLPHLSRLTQLKALTFSDTEITPEIIETINKFKMLKHLELQGSSVSADNLLKLERLEKLSGLCVQDLRGISPVIAKIKNAPKHVLENLDMSNCRLTDSDLEQLAEIESLSTLRLSFNNFGERGLTALQRLPHLTYLSIEGCNVSPACLKKFKKLGSLTLTHKFYSEAAIADLEKALNHCSIKTKASAYNSKLNMGEEDDESVHAHQ